MRRTSHIYRFDDIKHKIDITVGETLYLDEQSKGKQKMIFLPDSAAYFDCKNSEPIDPCFFFVIDDSSSFLLQFYQLFKIGGKEDVSRLEMNFGTVLFYI